MARVITKLRPHTGVVEPRLGWKLYAVVVISLLLWGYLRNFKMAWQLVFEVPLGAALVSYGWSKRWLPRVCWMGYGLFYLGRLVIQARDWTTQSTITDLFADFLIGGGTWNHVRLIYALTFTVFAFVIAPAVIVLWRLATDSPPRDSSISAHP